MGCKRFPERLALTRLALLAGGGLLTGCLGSNPVHGEQHLTGDFYLSWIFDERNRQLVYSEDQTGNTGTLVVMPTVVAAGHDEQFILLQRHPDRRSEIGNRLLDRDPATGDYLLPSPADTVFLDRTDSVYQREGRWHHTFATYSVPDSLYPDRRQTFYYLLDVRHRRSGGQRMFNGLFGWFFGRYHDRYRVYTFTDTARFAAKRRELGVSPRLKLTPLPEYTP